LVALITIIYLVTLKMSSIVNRIAISWRRVSYA